MIGLSNHVKTLVNMSAVSMSKKLLYLSVYTRQLSISIKIYIVKSMVKKLANWALGDGEKTKHQKRDVR